MVDRVASPADRREAGDAHSLAPQGIPVVVALEIADTRSATDSHGLAAVDREDGGRESDVGRGTVCRGAPGQARHSNLSADHSTVHAAATTADEIGKTEVEHLRAEPRTVGPRQ